MVVVPTGQYYPDKLINIGTDRWALKPELGISYIVDKKLYLDLYSGLWIYTDNPKFYTGSNVESQAVMSSTQIHVSYTFDPRFWAALDGTWYNGGATSVNGGPSNGASGQHSGRRPGGVQDHAGPVDQGQLQQRRHGESRAEFFRVRGSLSVPVVLMADDLVLDRA